MGIELELPLNDMKLLFHSLLVDTNNNHDKNRSNNNNNNVTNS
jgi:hypothetical protein